MKKSQALMCPRCGKLVSRNQPVCPWCGLTWPGKWFRFGFLMAYFARPGFLVQSLIGLNMFFFLVSLVLNLRGVVWSLSPFEALAPSSSALFLLGGTGTIPVFQYGLWWTVITAGFLHGGILHILFNMAALYHLGNLSEQVFGPFRLFLIFFVGNLVGFLLSLVGRVPFTIGASAAICGLLGALFYYGWHRGGPQGKAIFTHTQGWLIGLVLFGVFAPNINNWGHAGGFLGGLLVAKMLGYRENRSETMNMRLSAMGAAFLCLLFLLGNLVFALRMAGSLHSFF